jgi:uncharacterized protein YndB with AHSA1/START domain
MTTNLIASQSITINASISKIWDALTNPQIIKQYLFGTNVTTDWKVGSPILYHGDWQGKSYEDKGMIVELIPEKRLISTYWSSMSGSQDLPENYATVTYEIQDDNGGTKLTVTQDNNKDEESRLHSEKNWGMVLANIKQLLEK